MATKEGKKTGGRQKGTPNKKTKGLIEKLEEINYCPVDELIKLLRKPPTTEEELAKLREDLANEGYEEDEIDEQVNEICSSALKHDKRADINLKLMEYIYPKRKAVDIKDEDDGKGGERVFKVAYDKSELRDV